MLGEGMRKKTQSTEANTARTWEKGRRGGVTRKTRDTEETVRQETAGVGS